MLRLGPGRTFPLSESFMFFFNIWLVFIILHLGKKYIVVDIISRFIHEPYALAWLGTAVVLGIVGMLLRKPTIRIVGNMAACVWWGTVWMLYLITLKTVLTLAFSVYLLPLVVSITVITQNYQLLTKKEGQRQKTDPVK